MTTYDAWDAAMYTASRLDTSLLEAYRPKPIPADYGWIGALLRNAFYEDLEAEAVSVTAPERANHQRYWRDEFLTLVCLEAGHVAR